PTQPLFNEQSKQQKARFNPAKASGNESSSSQISESRRHAVCAARAAAEACSALSKLRLDSIRSYHHPRSGRLPLHPCSGHDARGFGRIGGGLDVRGRTTSSWLPGLDDLHVDFYKDPAVLEHR